VTEDDLARFAPSREDLNEEITTSRATRPLPLRAASATSVNNNRQWHRSAESGGR